MIAYLLAIILAPVAYQDADSAPSQPRFSGPAKMIIFSGSGVGATDYPSQVRCEAARAAFANIIEAVNGRHPPTRLPNGGVIYTPGLVARTICIPG